MIRILFVLTSLVFCFGTIASACQPDDVDEALQPVIKATDTAIQESQDELVASFQSAINKIKSSKSMTLEKQLETIEDLQNQSDQFLSAKTLPSSPLMKQAVKRYTQKITSANKSFESKARKVAAGFRDWDDFESVRKILDIIKSRKSPAVKNNQQDPMIGTTWNFLGTGQQKINRFVFKTNGTVDADNSYPDANWKRLDDETILFQYAPKSSYIVFHPQAVGFMKGFHSKSGKVRFIRKEQ